MAKGLSGGGSRASKQYRQDMTAHARGKSQQALRIERRDSESASTRAANARADRFRASRKKGRQLSGSLMDHSDAAQTQIKSGAVYIGEAQSALAGGHCQAAFSYILTATSSLASAYTNAAWANDKKMKEAHRRMESALMEAHKMFGKRCFLGPSRAQSRATIAEFRAKRAALRGKKKR